jgi:endonuclease YncB( thermonuclease family)
MEHLDLSKINISDVSNVPFKDRMIKARVIDVIDGDTIKVVILLGNHPLKLNVRLSGIDTPELHPKPVVHEEEPRVASLVKSYVGNLLNKDQIVTIKLLSLDKYGGRYVGHIYIKDDTTTMSDHLVSIGCAKVYNGKKKECWAKQDLTNIQCRLEESAPKESKKKTKK